MNAVVLRPWLEGIPVKSCLPLGILVSAALAAFAPHPARCGPVCPTTELSLSTADVYTTTAAALDTSRTPSSGQFSVAYDLVSGTFRFFYCCSILPTYVTARDAYDVAGVPAGTPVSVTATFTVDDTIFDSGSCGGTGCSGSFAASIQHGTDSARASHSPSLFRGARATYHDVVQLPLTIVAGQPETIAFGMSARRATGGSHGASASGSITFTGLPPGAAVTSCQGFGGNPTPARTSSWGRIKLLYR